MSVLPVQIPSVGRWSLAPRRHTTVPVVDRVESSAIGADGAAQWVRPPLPMPLFAASTAVGSLAVVLAGVGFLVLR